MSASIGLSSYGPLDRMLAASNSLQAQVATLQQQTTTGLVAQSYAGLAPVASQVLDLTAVSNQNSAYSQSITNAQGKASVMQDALSQVMSMVSDMSSATLGLTGSNPASSVESVAQQAKDALAQLGSLLNTTYDGDYVFSGADTSNPPVPSTENLTTSGMYTQIGAQVSALTSNPTTLPLNQVIANTVEIAGSQAAGTTVFSSYLAGAGASATPNMVNISATEQVSLDLPANRNVGAVSDPTIQGTGNAISDIMRSLAVVANSTPSMATNPDFSALMQNVATTLTSANTTVSEESGQIGLTQNRMTAAASANASMQQIMAQQLSGLTDVNMTSAISQLQTVTSQLQASYQVLAMAKSLNLASYL